MATPRRSGLRLDADLRDTEFVRYFSIVQDAAKRLGCVFYLWSPEARDGQVGDVWCEDLSGWLVPAHDADAFEDVWRNSDPQFGQHAVFLEDVGTTLRQLVPAIREGGPFHAEATMISIGNGMLMRPDGTVVEKQNSALGDVPTADMVGELQRRPGVLSFEIGPDGRGKVTYDGPATVLVVLD